MKKVYGGFNKWSIQFDKKIGCIKIEFDHYPNSGTIILCDVFEEDLKNLSMMFAQAAGNKGKA